MHKSNILKKLLFFSIFILLFVFSRFLIIYSSENHNTKQDIKNFAAYSYSYYKAKEKHQNFYKYFQNLKKTSFPNNFTDENNFEYPPMVLSFSLLPSLFIAKKIIHSKSGPSQYVKIYIKYFRRMCFCIESVIFIIILFLSINHGDKFWKQVSPPLYFIIINFCQPATIYERSDIALSALIFISLLLLTTYRKYFASYFFLAAAICFKITPIILIPLWILFTLSKAHFTRLNNLIKAACIRLIILFVLILALTLPYLLLFGESCLSFFKYHYSRGVQIESIYANIIQIYYHYKRVPYTIYSNFGSINITKSTDLSTNILTVLLAISLIFIYFFVSKIVMQKLPDNSVTTFANIDRRNTVLVIIITIMCSIIFSKVFSPQYLIWITSLLPLLLILKEKKDSKIFYILFIIICILTSNLLLNYYLLETKTNIGLIILTIRNSLFILCLILLLKDFFRKSKK